MSKPMVNEFNVITNEYTYREMTDEEYSFYLAEAERIKSSSIEG